MRPQPRALPPVRKPPLPANWREDLLAIPDMKDRLKAYRKLLRDQKQAHRQLVKQRQQLLAAQERNRRRARLAAGVPAQKKAAANRMAAARALAAQRGVLHAHHQARRAMQKAYP